jgi:hypothetical protein
MLRLHAESSAAEHLAQTFLPVRLRIPDDRVHDHVDPRPASQAGNAARAARARRRSADRAQPGGDALRVHRIVNLCDANFFASSEYIRVRACVSIVCRWGPIADVDRGVPPRHADGIDGNVSAQIAAQDVSARLQPEPLDAANDLAGNRATCAQRRRRPWHDRADQRVPKPMTAVIRAFVKSPLIGELDRRIAPTAGSERSS